MNINFCLILIVTVLLQDIEAKINLHRGRCLNRVYRTTGFCQTLDGCAILSQTQKDDHNLIEDLRCNSESNKIICCPKSYGIIERTRIPQLLPEPPHCGQMLIENKIFGGMETAIAEFPWMAILLYEEENIICGGTLIAQRWVLTAAHCVHNQHVRYVRLGEWNIEMNPDCQDGRVGKRYCAPAYIEIEVLHSIPHPEFVPSGNYANDIALLHLAEPVIVNDWIKPICLPRSSVKVSDFVGISMDIAGWGRQENISEGSKIMLKANVSVWLKETCQAVIGQLSLHQRQLCAGNTTGSCRGDSGGPLMQNRNRRMYQVGVISTGGACKAQNLPVVFTKVDDYIQWIGFEMDFINSLHIN